MELPQIDNYQELFISDTPLLDVRAPIEFVQGAFPTALNLPLINDEERHAIGIRYKELGQDQAIELGHELVHGKAKETRVANWANFTQQNPQGVLYCFRGGMRSKISQQWIYEQTGVVYPRVKGGYKAMRRYLIEQLAQAVSEIKPIILAGRTGVGKTLLLNQLKHKIDLEGIYHHRGSAFGKHITPQPSQIDVENTLAITLLKLLDQNITQPVLEDEATAIGSRRLPDDLAELMQHSPLVLLEADIEQRVDIIFDEYITEALAEFRSALGNTAGFETWASNLQSSLQRIQRRLGGQRYKDVNQLMDQAIKQHRENNDPLQHKHWIHSLLKEYYDPMYDYQLNRKSERIVFRGDSSGVLDYLNK